MAASDESGEWLARRMASAKAEVAKWPEWKKQAMRVLPEPAAAEDAPSEQRAGAEESPSSE